MKIVATLALLLTIVLFSCEKEHMKYTTVYYQQTYCSDPWPTGTTDSLTLVNVAHFIDSIGVYIASLGIRQDHPADACTACACKTGKVIYLTTFEGDEMPAVAFGFR